MKTRIFAPLPALILAALVYLPQARGADPAPTEAPMRELGTVTPTPTVDVSPTPTPHPTVTPAPTVTQVPTSAPVPTTAPAATIAVTTPTPTPSKHHHYHGVQDSDDDGNRVAVGSESYVGPEEKVEGNAVAVFGPLAIDGSVDGNAVEIFGEGRIDGTVHGNVVAVMGSLHLGPHAHIDGYVNTVGGDVVRDDGAYTAHGIRSEDMRGLVPKHFRWFWIIGCLAIYVLITHMFPKGVEKCADTLAHRPGATLLTGVLAVIALPFVWIILMVTIVGIFLVPLAVFCTILYGRAAINYLIGRPLVGKVGAPAAAALVGGVIVALFYLIPIVGLLAVLILNFLAFAAAVTTYLAPAREAVAVRPIAPPPVVPPVVPLAPVVPPAAQGLDVPVAAVTETPVAPAPVDLQATPPPFVPPVIPPPVMQPVAPPPLVLPVAAVPAAHGAEYLLPRAAFWPRMAALFIDLIIISVVAHGLQGFSIVVLAAYGAVMWKFKGTTLGGIILGHKVVRIDGRPLDWPTALVRAGGCFISVFVAGLGFIWIAVDPERQAWHDRIAGTVVVKLPKAQPLV